MSRKPSAWMDATIEIQRGLCKTIKRDAPAGARLPEPGQIVVVHCTFANRKTHITLHANCSCFYSVVYLYLQYRPRAYTLLY